LCGKDQGWGRNCYADGEAVPINIELNRFADRV
jgi:hypothetical protein